jgi:hypothetical protein
MLVIGFLFITFLTILPDLVSAAYLWDGNYEDEYLEINVLRAEYLDYDNDKIEDDIITVFEIIPPEDEWEGKGVLYISCAIEKPSGASITTSFEVKTRDGVEITIVWFNWADEPGDYTLYIKAEGVSDGDSFNGYIEHVFDPPGGRDDDMPHIAIMSIDEL